MLNQKLKTIILRFRDLATPDTIAAHKKVIDLNGEVWWGWWSKPQEKLPIEEFKVLRGLSRSENRLEIFLFNSGSEDLYTATCSDIDFENGDCKQSPNKEKTPSYYSDNQYMAWFKFTAISEPFSNGEAKTRLKKHSYYKVDDFFISGKSQFTPFYNKRVYSQNELFQQQRTIWFLKEFERGDKSHEIHSYMQSLTDGKNIQANFKVLSSPHILWLSDLHFSEKDKHAFITAAGDTNRLSIRLQNEINKMDSLSISSIIVSGDLTFSSTEKEFIMAEEFCRDMNSFFALSGADYCIVPGNHDIAFSNKPFNESDPVTVAFENAKELYVDFLKRIKGIEPEDELYSVHRLLTVDLKPLEIICMNSCLLQQDEEHFRGMGFAGNDQIRKIEDALDLTKGTDVFRILVLHHHLIPTLFKEDPKPDTMYSIMLDSEAVSQFIIRNNIKLVLHGHAHKEFYSEIIRKKDGSKYKYYIVGLGSTGVIFSKLSDCNPNMFAIITTESSSLIINGYSLFPNGQTSTRLFQHSIPFKEDSE